jgi:hypothetical protein
LETSTSSLHGGEVHVDHTRFPAPYSRRAFYLPPSNGVMAEASRAAQSEHLLRDRSIAVH